MQIKFDGDAHQIDSNTLINCLIHYNAVVAAANETLGQGEKKVSVKVNALEKGSFVIDLSLCEEQIISLFSQEHVEYLAALVTIVGGAFSAYKYFKGRKVKNKDEADNFKATFNSTSNNVSVTINDTIINVYNRMDVREAINSSIKTADEDEGVQGISIGNGETPDVVIKRDEFAGLEHETIDDDEDMPLKKEEIVDATLTIIGLSFERGNRWYFMYNGFKIAITVKDDALQKRIDAGDRFGKGDYIRVKMLIVKEYNKDYKAYENKRYKILEFYEHVIPPRQTDIFEGKS